MAPAFRFLPAEVAQLMAQAQQLGNGPTPDHAVMQALADHFTAARGRAGNNIPVQPRQVLTWFRNWRTRNYPAMIPRNTTVPLQMTPSVAHQLAASASRAQPSAAAQHNGSSSERGRMDCGQVQFEAKSDRDGAWYDVAAFLSQRNFETADPEVKVRLLGFGPEDDEWVKVRTCVRQRSVSFEAMDCASVVPGDLVLCFQEGTTHALYFDAHVTDIQRRRHDSTGCRCRFLVRYDHDNSEEIVRLRKLCRRPETDYRIQALHAARAVAAAAQSGPPETCNASGIGAAARAEVAAPTVVKNDN